MFTNFLQLDEFNLIGTLGEGYSGMVKLGIDRKDGNLYAIKILNKGSYNFGKVQKELIKEFALLRSLQHPNVIKMFKISLDGVLACNN